MKETITAEEIANYIEKNSSESSFWMDAVLLAKNLDVTRETIEKLTLSSKDMVINAQGGITTRKLYKKRTPLYKKLIDAFKNKIN